MRIGVISDTHMPRRGNSLPAFVRDAFKDVEMILHAGDIKDQSVLDELNQLAPTRAVAGNMDSQALVEQLGQQQLLEINGLQVGLMHGHVGEGRTPERRALNAFPDADVIVFGHTHQPYRDRYGKQLLLNPGSATEPRSAPRPSVAILTIDETGASATFIYG